MAAHLYRALLDTYGRGCRDIVNLAKELDFARGNSLSFADLFLDDYEEIGAWCADTINNVGKAEGADQSYATVNAHDNLKAMLMRMIPRYGQRWIDLGCPKYAEEWMARRFPPPQEEDKNED